ncbi:four helix bundle protein [Dyadobacter pollutisoli]|uniref:Four helix bundle protein n=1 Tax=Dyadobacter pollutisoli TaxID=2910158 RepID=A0A9E8SJC6_9BACT|nr:four helix bundle protein [Dyadobacter pollutisoli]WAC11205.1 four helix bundle protein [Dyadobacter pollutisoli]
MKLEELQIYQLAMSLGEKVWTVVEPWGYFLKDTLGKQLVRATDSIAANIAEGYGRFHFKENLNFCFYSRGSLQETRTWLTKARNRNLIETEKFEELTQLCDQLSIKLNNYIKTIGKTPLKLNDNK